MKRIENYGKKINYYFSIVGLSIGCDLCLYRQHKVAL
jgi:hypothetical protein